MEMFQGIDWRLLFVPTVPILEILLRASVIYLSLFILLRIVLKREAGTVSMTDLLFLVLIADAVQNGMAGAYSTVTEALLLAGTIIFWSYTLDWLAYKFPALERLLRPRSLLLVKDGALKWRNMRRELITQKELMSVLRSQGVEDLDQVKEMYMEGDGQFSVITYDEEKHKNPSRKDQPGV